MNIKQVIAETAHEWHSNSLIGWPPGSLRNAVLSTDGEDDASAAYHTATGQSPLARSGDDTFYAQHGNHHVFVSYGPREGDSHEITVNHKHVTIPALSDDAEHDMRENDHYQLASDEVASHLHGHHELSLDEKTAAHNAIMSGFRSLYAES